ncbi:MAG: MATE family efflux transporter [Acidimicrobiales bacterium]
MPRSANKRFAAPSLPRWSPHDRAIVRLAVPAFGALVAEPLYVLADTAVVGHLGTPELGGVAVASSVLLTFHGLSIFLAYGTTAAVARRMGARDEAGAAGDAVQSLWLALGIAVVSGAIVVAAAEPLLRSLGAEGEVLRHGLTYLRISVLGLPAMLATLAGTGWLRGIQDTRTPLAVAVGTAVANLVLELWLIYGLGYGIGASALSTVVVQCAGAAVYMRSLHRGASGLSVPLRPHLARIRGLARVGWDLVVRTAALRAAFVLATAVATRIGPVELAAHQISFEIWTALALGLDAVAIAGQALIGTHLGAQEARTAREVGDRMLRWGIVLGVVAGLGVLALRGVLPDVFTGDPPVASLVTFLLLWVAVLQPLNGIVFVLDGLLIGAGDQRHLAKAMVVSLAVYAPVAVAVGALGWGIGWLWAAIATLMAARLVTLLSRWRSEGWAGEPFAG